MSVNLQKIFDGNTQELKRWAKVSRGQSHRSSVASQSSTLVCRQSKHGGRDRHATCTCYCRTALCCSVQTVSMPAVLPQRIVVGGGGVVGAQALSAWACTKWNDHRVFQCDSLHRKPNAHIALAHAAAVLGWHHFQRPFPCSKDWQPSLS